METGKMRLVLAVCLVLALTGGIGALVVSKKAFGRTTFTALFDNSNGIFVGDEVRILGVPVGAIESIRPATHHAEIRFWIRDKYKVPADAKAVIVSPSLVTSRAIQLTPAYTNGPEMKQNSTIPLERTAVPVEWDDFRDQLKKLTDYLQPTEPGGVSTIGSLVNTSADNLRGQGATIREAITQLAQAFSVLGDHSKDISSTVKNLSALVRALQSSTDLMSQLNRNLAAVSGLLANDPDEVGRAVDDLSGVVGDVTSFVSENREALGTTSDKLTSVSTALVQSMDDVKQALHIMPTAFSNYINIYEPAHASLTGALAVNNFANPIQFICSAIQAASRLNNEQSAKLCVQYLAPIVKNRQFNFPPIGLNPFVNAQARPNEVTYSEDWMRPDYVPPAPAVPPDQAAPSDQAAPPAGAPLPAEAAAAVPAPPTSTEPADGLPGLMVPAGGAP